MNVANFYLQQFGKFHPKHFDQKGRRAELQRICKNLSADQAAAQAREEGAQTLAKGNEEISKRYKSVIWGQFLVFHQANFQFIIIG